MSKSKQLDPPLERLVEVLRASPEGLTARQLAASLFCSKPTVYARIARLVEHGIKLATKDVRDGVRGPKACSFSLK
jgi:predicted DNA-binding transcriptional regulator YafY